MSEEYDKNGCDDCKDDDYFCDGTNCKYVKKAYKGRLYLICKKCGKIKPAQFKTEEERSELEKMAEEKEGD